MSHTTHVLRYSYLDVYTALIFETAVKRGDVIVPHEEIDLELTRETHGVLTNVDKRKMTLSIGVSVEKRKFLRYEYKEQVMRGHNIVAIGRAGASKPPSHTQTYTKSI